MSDNGDAFARSVALEKALTFWKADPSAQDVDVLKTAEAFRAFLAGETKEDPDPRPLFILPKRHDGFVYYRFWSLKVLYRADTSYGDVAGGVSRISLTTETEWVPRGHQDPNGTRRALNQDNEYVIIPALEAARLIQENVKGVRFA